MSLLVVGVLACLSLVAGCVNRTVTVPLSAGSVRVPEGDILEVEMGEVNPSIGDAWFLVDPPESGVLIAIGRDIESDDVPGSGGPMTWSFAAHRAGTATLTFQYCYQTTLQDCRAKNEEPAPDPVRLRVTVE